MDINKNGGIKIKILRTLGLVGLMGLAGACGNKEQLVTENPAIKASKLCRIANNPFTSSTESIETNAIDTDGDGRYDEAFVTRSYVNVSLGTIVYDDIAKVTTHYVAPGVEPSKQKFNGFPDTRAMTPEYQNALRLVCNYQ